MRTEQLVDLESVRDEWSALAERTRNIFATWEFASVWWRHFGRGRRLFAAAVRSDAEDVIGVLPLYEWSGRPLRVLRFLGHQAGDQLGPICTDADRPATARALRFVLSEARPDVFIGEQLAADERWSTCLEARVLSREGSPVLPLGGRGWDDLLASKSANLREQVRRRERALMRDHEVRYRLTATERLQEDLTTLFSLHALRWRGRSTRFGARESFHREFASCALARGWLRLWFLEIDGRAVAAWYGFRFGEVESYYQMGRDPAWDRGSVGFVLLAHTIRAAVVDGMSEYRFLRGDESYKYRFAEDDPGLETIAVTRGGTGKAALAAARSFRALRRGLDRSRVRAAGSLGRRRSG